MIMLSTKRLDLIWEIKMQSMLLINPTLND